MMAHTQGHATVHFRHKIAKMALKISQGHQQ